MNILNKFTIKSLKLNKKRTTVTIIGIILSTALICAVAGVFSSFQATLIEHAKQSDGNYHATFFNVKKEDQKYIMQNRNVESYFITQDVGYAKLEGSINKYKPYLHLMEFDKTALNSYGLKLLEGRMPENSNEIIISDYIETNGGVNYEIGDKITLDISKRIADGYELNQNNPYNNPEDAEFDDDYVEEHLEKMFTKEYTVVGKIERPNMEIEDYSAPGFTIITLLDEIRENANISVIYENINNTYKVTEEISQQTAYLDGASGDYINTHINSELMRWSGVTKSEETLQVLYSLVAIVIGIIIVSSVFVIRNSFAISITEKMKQYGMLASIGATRKQIKKNVLFEGLILGLIGIPIGIICGVLATFVLIKITTLLIGEGLFASDITFVFKVPLVAILLSVVLGFVTIYLSCIFSARKASKVSPIEAIRSNEDIKIKSKKVRAPKIIKKLFGIGGDIAYKNLKRNKKKYRTTVISLVVSITIFIALSSFIEYMIDMTGVYYKDQEYNVSLRFSNENEDYNDEIYQDYKKIIEQYNIEQYSIIRNIFAKSSDIQKYYTDDYKKNRELNEVEDTGEEYLDIMAIGDWAFNDYVKKLGGNPEDYENGFIYINNSYNTLYNEKTEHSEKIETLNLKEKDEIKFTLEDTGEEFSLPVLKITEETPFGIGNTYSNLGTFIISDKLVEKLGNNYNNYGVQIYSEDPYQLCENIEKEYDAQENRNYKLFLTNYQEEIDNNKRIILLISIFLYGFITVITLIGVTNIFNTITTNMNLRSKEFAMLKSIGMTKKEFNKMINLESIFYGVKSLLIGCILGIGLSYWIFRVGNGAEATNALKYAFPVVPILIAIVFIMVIVGIIMRYSLSKINKQNIIETIRKDNI